MLLRFPAKSAFTASRLLPLHLLERKVRMRHSTTGYAAPPRHGLGRALGLHVSHRLAAGLILLLALFTGTNVLLKFRTQDRELATLADLTAFNSSAAVAFEDPRASNEILNTLRVIPAICHARLSTGAHLPGKTLAEYRQDNKNACPDSPAPTLHRLERPVHLQELDTGWLTIHYDRSPLYPALITETLVAATALLALFLLLRHTLHQALRQQVENPLHKLDQQLAELCEHLTKSPSPHPPRLPVNGLPGSLQHLATQINRLLATQALQDRQQHTDNRSSPLTLSRAETPSTDQGDWHAHDLHAALPDFLAAISHEIRTPLNGLFGMAELLGQGPLTPEQQEQLHTLQSSASDLFELINQLLGLGELDANTTRLPNTRFSPRQLLDTLSQHFDPRAKRKGLELHCQLAPDLPDTLTGDMLRLHHLLALLLSQTIRNTTHGQIRFQISGLIPHPDLVDSSEPCTSYLLQCTLQDSSTGHSPLANPGISAIRQLLIQLGGTLHTEHTPGWGSRYQLGFPVRVDAPV